MKPLNFRIGTTSYIIPDDIVPNVHYLAGKVDDIELVLFEVDEGPSNLLTPPQQAALAALAQQNKMTYTVHLPLDLHLTDDPAMREISFAKAKKAIDCTHELNPFAYVLHLEGKDRLAGKQSKEAWLEQALSALDLLAEWVGGHERLAAENLENYPIDFIDEVFDHRPVSRTIDIGHLWLMNEDPIPFLEKHIDRARVLHIHGIGDRDHCSLRHVAPEELERVIGFIQESGFDGVMTVEVFSDDDFGTSFKHLAKVFDSLQIERPPFIGDKKKPAKYHRALYESSN